MHSGSGSAALHWRVLNADVAAGTAYVVRSAYEAV